MFDSIVIGAGPAGITAALYLVRSGLKVLLIEAVADGGQVLLTYEIENYPGFPHGIKGYELADTFSAHLAEYKFDKIQTSVEKIEHLVSKSIVHTAKGSYEGKTIIIASGSTNKKLGIDREAELTGKGVSYCAVCDGNFYRNQDVAIVGGGNSALEEALYLSRIVNKVYLIHRRDSFRASKIYIDKVCAMPEKIELITESIITELQGENSLESLQVKNLKTNKLSEIQVSGLFIFVGTKANNSFLPVGLQLNDAGYIITDTEMKTSLEGIFAAGDIRQKHCRQVAAAVGDGATAATSAIAYLELN